MKFAGISNPVLCDSLEGWEMGRGLIGERIYISLWLIHVDTWEKSAQYYKAIKFQLKIKFKKEVDFFFLNSCPSLHQILKVLKEVVKSQLLLFF